jgi:hypothetical protein
MRHFHIPLLLTAALAACGPNDDIGNEASFHTDTPEPATDIGEGESWILVQSHLHTTGQHGCANSPLDPGPLPDGECYTAEGIEGFLEAALDYGATDMIITDHNTVDAWFDPAFVPMASADGSRYATPLRGSEWSSGEGHMTVFFPRQVVDSNAEAFDQGLLWGPGNHSDDPSEADYRAAIAQVQNLGGLVVINHPKLTIHAFDDATYGADGVEVGVKLKPVLQSTSATRMWWHHRLLEGDRITGMAGSDHHHGGGDLPMMDEPIFGVAVNLMRVDPTLPSFANVDAALAEPDVTIDQRSDIAADAIRRGHIMVVEDKHTPRLYLGADTDGDGYYHDARAGDCLPASYQGDTLPVRIRVDQADGEGISGHYNVKLYTAESTKESWFYVALDPDEGFAESHHYAVDPDNRFAIELDVPVDHSQPGFVRVEIEKDNLGPYNDAKTIANPIYFGPWGAECETSQRL